MDVYVGKEFPVVARYATKKVDGTPFFRGQEEEINSVSINKTAITPTNVSAEGDDSSRTYTMDLVSPSTNIDLTMKVKISVDDNDLTLGSNIHQKERRMYRYCYNRDPATESSFYRYVRRECSI